MRKLTKEDFLERAEARHGGIYDYSFVKYINSRTNVTVVCREHGPFNQMAGHHIAGSGCPECGISKQNKSSSCTVEDFVSAAREKHRDYYDYSETVYNGANYPLDVICPIHGKFSQRANQHLSGAGCKRCVWETLSAEAANNRQDFIDKATKKFGGKFDYSLVTYTNRRTKVDIICPIHGTFSQTPENHLGRSKNGCGQCANTVAGINGRGTLEDFIEEARGVHGKKYDYSGSVYTTNTALMDIKCLLHGSFQASKIAHLKVSGGCPGCKIETIVRVKQAKEYDKEIFVEMANALHENKYTYEKLVYKQAKDVGVMTCPIHGDWQQKIRNHLKGGGCPECSVLERGNRSKDWPHPLYHKSGRKSSIYLLEIINQKTKEIYIKVGVSVDVKSRVRNISKKSQATEINVIIEKTCEGPETLRIERDVLKVFKHQQYKPKTYFDGCSECFSFQAKNEVVRHILSLTNR